MTTSASRSFNGQGYRSGAITNRTALNGRGYRGGNWNGRGGNWNGRGRWGHHGHHHHRHHHGFYPYYAYYPFGFGFGYPYWVSSYYYDNSYAYDGNAYGGSNGNSVVTNVQQQLAQAGYYHGAIDGIIGDGTRRAIRAYESANGLHVDGRIDSDLLSHMGLS